MTVQQTGEEDKDGDRGKNTVRQALVDTPGRGTTHPGVQNGQEDGASLSAAGARSLGDGQRRGGHAEV